MKPSGKRPMRNMTMDQKLNAIRRVSQGGESKAAVARDIGVPESTLRGWCKNEKKLEEAVDRESRSPQASTSRASEPSMKRTRFTPPLDAAQPYNLSTRPSSTGSSMFSYSPSSSLDSTGIPLNESATVPLNLQSVKPETAGPSTSRHSPVSYTPKDNYVNQLDDPAKIMAILNQPDSPAKQEFIKTYSQLMMLQQAKSNSYYAQSSASDMKNYANTPTTSTAKGQLPLNFPYSASNYYRPLSKTEIDQLKEWMIAYSKYPVNQQSAQLLQTVQTYLNVLSQTQYQFNHLKASSSALNLSSSKSTKMNPLRLSPKPTSSQYNAADLLTTVPVKTEPELINTEGKIVDYSQPQNLAVKIKTEDILRDNKTMIEAHSPGSYSFTGETLKTSQASKATSPPTAQMAPAYEWLYKDYCESVNKSQKPILYQQLTRPEDYKNSYYAKSEASMSQIDGRSTDDEHFVEQNENTPPSSYADTAQNKRKHTLSALEKIATQAIKTEISSETIGDRAEAIENGEKFLEWLETQSSPFITAIQIGQFKTLLNAAKKDPEQCSRHSPKSSRK